MRSRTRLFAAIVAALALVVTGASAARAQGQAGTQPPPAKEKARPEAQDKSQDKDKAQDNEKAAADPITGDWEGLVDLSDGAMAFSMKLKLEKDKVAGEIGSGRGTASITEGSWADGKLTLAFTYSDGAGVVMTGSSAEGNLSGSLVYGGQMTVAWAAKKKAAK